MRKSPLQCNFHSIRCNTDAFEKIQLYKFEQMRKRRFLKVEEFATELIIAGYERLGEKAVNPVKIEFDKTSITDNKEIINQNVNTANEIDIPSPKQEPDKTTFDFKGNGYLDNEEVNAYSKISITEICKAHKDGSLKFIQHGHKFFHKKEDVDKWIIEHLEKKFSIQQNNGIPDEEQTHD